MVNIKENTYDEFTTESRLEIIRGIVRNKNEKLNSLKRIRNER